MRHKIIFITNSIYIHTFKKYSQTKIICISAGHKLTPHVNNRRLAFLAEEANGGGKAFKQLETIIQSSAVEGYFSTVGAQKRGLVLPGKIFVFTSYHLPEI